ncbi:MAG TPA: transglutaminase domain-containing protein [Dictyobacter sp.]|nr:transglutaminase domain-containing protein [Dictyobacter sp.]
MRSGLLHHQQPSSGDQRQSIPRLDASSPSGSSVSNASSPQHNQIKFAHAQARSVDHIRFPGPAEGWLALIFLGIALFCILLAITKAGWVQDSNMLFYPPIFGLLLGLLVAKAPYIPQAILHLLACIVGLVLAFWFTCVPTYHIAPGVLLTALQAAFAAQPLSASFGVIVFFFYLAFLSFFLGYFGSWLVYRAHLPWLVVLVYCSIMLVNLNYIPHDLTYLVVIMVAALALLIARTRIALQIERWRQDGLYTDPTWISTMTRRCMQVASLVTVIAIVFSWLLPVFAQPTNGKVFWDKLDTSWTDVTNGRFSFQDISSLTSSDSGSQNFFGDQLQITGSVTLPQGKVLTYRSSDNQPHYLEGFTYNQFDGHVWTAVSPTTFYSDYFANDTLPVDVMNQATQISTTVSVTNPPGGTKPYIFGPAQPDRFSVPVSTASDGQGGTTTAWVKQGPLTQMTYTVDSAEPSASAQALSSVPLPEDDSAFWQSNFYISTYGDLYLSIPGDLSPNSNNLAHIWTSGANNAYQALMDLQNHLSDTTNFKYSVNNPPIPANEDVVDVLLQTHTGYCTYYATTMAIMGRELGIPTRVVNGFSIGHLVGNSQDWEVDGDDAHSWVQAYLPNYGWIDFDPTPGFSTGNAAVVTQPTPATTPQTQPTTAPAVTPTIAAKPTVTPSHPTTHANVTGTTNVASLWLYAALAVLIAAVLVFVFAVRQRQRRQCTSQAIDVTSLFWRFCHLAGLFGLGPQKWQTPYEYSNMLSMRFPQQSRSIQQLTNLFVRERWGGPRDTPQRQEVAAAQHLWPTLRTFILHTLMVRGCRKHPR